MVAQGYVLAARAFADELRSSIDPCDAVRVSEMAKGIETCMQCLQLLKATLVTMPDTSSDKLDS